MRISKFKAQMSPKQSKLATGQANKGQMANANAGKSKVQSSNVKYDLGERTAKFGEEVIEFVQTLSNTPVNRPLKSQLVRAGTSIGANYMEADAAESGRDFNHKIALCKKEAKETTHWLRMVAKANPGKKEQCRKLYQEARELTLIFSSILNRRRKGK